MKVGSAKIPSMSYTEEQRLKQEAEHLEDVMRGAEIRNESGESVQGLNWKPQDLDALEKRLDGIQNTIRERGINSPVQGKEREFYEKKERLLREHFHKINPTYNEYIMSRPTDGPRYTKLVQENVRQMQDKDYQALVREWKDARRRLDPDNPYAADVRELYKQ